jgi:5-methylcytosine-specific restriction protein B
MADELVNARIATELTNARDAVAARGELLSVPRLEDCYAAFRGRFAPEKLQALDGLALLEVMHTHGNKDSLVYWLEFKNDDEFPGPSFGSISGGSAFKFRIFRRADTQQWVKGSPQHDENITEAEAILIATQHRDQLSAGAALLERLPPGDSNDEAYERLQGQITQAAPDLYNLTWAHKYWSLLHPDKLDDFNSQSWQRFHLVKILQAPPASDGLFVCAGRFVRLGAQLGWPLNHVTSALNERSGSPVSYWRIGTQIGDSGNVWNEMRDGGFAAIGWSGIGDLSPLQGTEDCKAAIRAKVERHYPGDAGVLTRHAGEIRNFAFKIAEGDIVLAADGKRIHGIGRVTGPYQFSTSGPASAVAPHRRPVEWLQTSDWNLPLTEGLRTTVYGLKKFNENALAVEQRLFDGGGVLADQLPRRAATRRGLDGIPGRVEAILERKGQAILFGPPGTGKTYWGRRTALDVAAIGSFGRAFEELTSEERATIEGLPSQPGLVRFCTFHPAYGYEDFIEGYRPLVHQSGQLAFQIRDGIFKRICADGRSQPNRKFVLLIDEINRGDIPRIFGELLTVLEWDKRGTSVILPLSGESFEVPQNVFVLGTMNTADRSIALLDTALRRRFGFIELLPDVAVFGSAAAGGVPLGPWLRALNERVREHLGRDGRNLQIGHAYLLENRQPVIDFPRFVRILAEDIVPLLAEYCYEDYGILAKILGSGLVDTKAERVREDIFSVGKHAELVGALLSLSPEIATTPAAATASDEDESEPLEDAAA